MTELQQHAMRVRQLLSEEADDYGADRIEATTRLRDDLNLSGVQRLALAFRLEAEFGMGVMDEAGFEAITCNDATAGDVLTAVERHLSKKGITT